MPLPPNLKATLDQQFHNAHHELSIEGRGNIQSSNNLLRHIVVKKFDEMTPEVAMAVNKVLALPK